MKIIAIANNCNLCLVDDEDYECVINFNWRFNGKYIIAYMNKQTIMIHRLIMKAEKGQIIDHKFGDVFDNRKEYLRFASHSQNSWNRPAKGVIYAPINPQKKYVVKFKVHGKRIYIGSYRTYEEARMVYVEAIKKHVGEEYTERKLGNLP